MIIEIKLLISFVEKENSGLENNIAYWEQKPDREQGEEEEMYYRGS